MTCIDVKVVNDDAVLSEEGCCVPSQAIQDDDVVEALAQNVGFVHPASRQLWPAEADLGKDSVDQIGRSIFYAKVSLSLTH
jgi:hypothetical protein